MTNINCTSNCLYQKDGKCELDNVTIISVTSNDSCIYFTAKKQQDSKEL